MTATTLAPPRRSAGGRAAVAVVLLLGFYLIGLGIVAALVGMDLWMLSNGRVPARIIFVTGVISVAILRGMFFVERGSGADDVTGIEVTDAEEPRLWAMVREVAASLGTDPPKHLFLVPDVNAFVFQRSRFLGIVPGERVMGIGVPLLQVMTTDELRGVLAHEFGHYTGGDTRLGPLVYRGRASIGRTIHHLGDSFVGKVFETYGKLYMRVSQAVSRRQELDADTNAAHLVGAGAHASALRKVHVAGLAFDEYVGSYVAPLWEGGKRPSALYEGFRLFHDHPDHAEAKERVATRMAERETDPYDSHPSLGVRLAALGDAATAGAPDDGDRAVALLADPERTDDRMSALVSRLAARNDTLVPVAWDDDAAAAITAPFVQDASERLHAAVAQVTGERSGVGGALALVEGGRLHDLAVAIEPRLPQVPDEERDRVARDIVVKAVAGGVAAALAGGGWRWALRWNDSAVLLSPTGTEWDYWTAVAEAVEDPAKVKPLRTRLKRHGVAA